MINTSNCHDSRKTPVTVLTLVSHDHDRHLSSDRQWQVPVTWTKTCHCLQNEKLSFVMWVHGE